MPVTAYAPASVANLCCGFDVLGLAVDAPGDEVTVSFNEEGIVRVVEIKGDDGRLPYELHKNTAGVAVESLWKAVKAEKGIDIAIHKKMPFGSGLGSSAASAVAGVVAANELLGCRLKKHELISYAIDGETVASGSRHGDNIVPSLLGGIVLVRGEEGIELPVPNDLHVTVIHPHVEILTKVARDILPQKVPMKDAIYQSANLGTFVVALYQQDLKLLGESMVDKLAEPYRSTIMPAYGQVQAAANQAGAFAFGISGAGPSMFAFADKAEKATAIGSSMKKALELEEIGSTVYTSKVNKEGAKIIS